MASKKTAIIIGLVLLIAAALAISIAKAKALVRIFQKITMEPNRVSNISISLNQINFNIDILMINPSPDAFEVNGMGIASLKEISVYYDGVFVAKSFPNISEIAIPAENQLVLPNIPVVINEPLKLLASNLTLAYSMIQNFDVNKLSTTGVIRVAGQDINI
jgi:hypothetical protein